MLEGETVSDDAKEIEKEIEEEEELEEYVEGDEDTSDEV